MITIKLNQNHEIELDTNGNIVLADGIEAVANDVQCRVLFNQGENPYDLQEGINYNDNVLGKFGGEDFIKEMYKKVIANAEDIVSVQNVQLKRSGSNLEITADVNTIYGVVNV